MISSEPVARTISSRWRRVSKPLSFEPRCGRAFGQIYAAVSRVGRKARGARTVDLMIAATALAHELPLYTLNAADLCGLEDLVEIVDLG